MLNTWVDEIHKICGVAWVRWLRLEANGKVLGRPLSSIGHERAACDDLILINYYLLTNLLFINYFFIKEIIRIFYCVNISIIVFFFVYMRIIKQIQVCVFPFWKLPISKFLPFEHTTSSTPNLKKNNCENLPTDGSAK